MAQPEPAHEVGQDLKVSLEQPAVVHPAPAHDVGEDLKVIVEQSAEDTLAAVLHPLYDH